MKKIKEKLLGKRGMSLSEVLVAVLILSLVTVGVATGVTASVRVYHESTTLSDAQTLSSTLSIAVMDELRFARDIAVDSNQNVTSFTSPNYGEDVMIWQTEGKLVVAKPGGQFTATGGKPWLVSTGAYADGLTADVAEMTYDAADRKCTVKLDVKEGENTVCSTEFSVRPLNE